ncbi:MAG: acyl-[acyl-carrier-protein] thioesterase [Anaerolineae bacterium]|nr:acyl-[acyl-carrier-protein] thioesterase [Anaerolineae bacterium]
MSLISIQTVTTRISDLDSQRHVNNRIYEHFCADSRYRLLQEHGYPINKLLEQGISLRPIATHVKFRAQQSYDSTLQINTVAYPMENGAIFWDHNILQPDEKLACHLQAETRSVERSSAPVELLPVTHSHPEQILIEDVPAFSGTCSRASSSFNTLHSDADTFGNLPTAALWRIFEEGRYMAGGQLGLTLDRFLQFDTHIFWLEGTYRFHTTIKPGQTLTIYTWLERIVRIRAYIRQEIRSQDGAQLLAASREEHLIVSLETSRPKAMPSQLSESLGKYIEYPA